MTRLGKMILHENIQFWPRKYPDQLLAEGLGYSAYFRPTEAVKDRLLL